MYPFPTIEQLRELIQLAKREDLGAAGDDVTSRLLIDESAVGVGTLVQKEVGIVCGLPIVEMVGNARLEAVTIGVRADKPASSVIVARGQYDAKGVAAALGQHQVPSTIVDGMQVFQPEKSVALLRRIDSEYAQTPAAEKARKRLEELGLGTTEEELVEEEVPEPAPASGPKLPPGFTLKKT